MEEEKKNPAWKQKDAPLNGEVKVLLLKNEPFATGSSQYGIWQIRDIKISNQRVYEGRGIGTKTLENYTGEAVFFPSEKMEEKIMDITKGKEAPIPIIIKKTLKESMQGKPYTDYEVTFDDKSSGADNSAFTPSEERSDGLNDVERKFVDDVKSIISGGTELTDEQIVTGAKDEKYNIEEERVGELVKFIRG